jgi:hypothetical protein
MGSVAQFPGSIVNIFIQVFNSNWKFKEAWQEAWLKFQMTVLHVLGAMLCSSKVRIQASACMYMYMYDVITKKNVEMLKITHIHYYWPTYMYSAAPY